jgi:hypothetical protein
LPGNVLTPDFQRAADNLRGFLAAHGHETAPESDGITYDTLARRELLQRNRADCPRAVQRALKQ